MSIKISKEIKIALLGIVSLVLFLLGFNYLKGTGMFSSTRLIKAEYNDVQGITPSSFVLLQGFSIGNVSKVYLSPEHPGKVVVEMQVDKDIPIPVDSRAKIISSDLLGTKAVMIEKGQSAQMVAKEATLQGFTEQGMFDKLGASAEPAMAKAQSAIGALDTTIHNINAILDAPTQAHLRNSMASLDNTMNDMQQFAAELNQQRAAISNMIKQLNSFTDNLSKNNQTITNTLSNTEKITGDLSKANLDQTVTELKQTLSQLKTTLDKVNNGQGSLGKLMNDDQLYTNLKNTLATTNNLLYDISAQPQKYVNVSVFGKKVKTPNPPLTAPNAEKK
jgi:phospholipid/cholesterol/gamma-HCH transport system substrate-binding protein